MIDFQSVMDRGWIAAVALAGYVWRNHVVEDRAVQKTLTDKVSALSSADTAHASREELTRIHQRIDTLATQQSENHAEVLGHLIELSRKAP